MAPRALHQNPPLQLRRFTFLVGVHYQAWKEDRPLPAPSARARIQMVVFRQDDRVWRQ